MEPQKQIPKVSLPLTTSVEKALNKIHKGFSEKGDVLQMTGFPFRIFCFRHPDHVAEILRHQTVGITKNPKILPRVKYVMGNGGYILEGGAEWKKRRSEVQQAFKLEAITHYAEQVPALTNKIFEVFDSYAGTNNLVDITLPLRHLITRINFKIFFSVDLDEENSGLNNAKISEIEHKTHALNLDFVRALPLFIPTPRNLKFKYNERFLRNLMSSIVKERRKNPGDKKDLLSVLLKATDKDTGVLWTDKDIVDEIFSVYFGASVVSTTLAWCMHLIVSNPEVQEKLIQEIQTTLKDQEPTVEVIKSMSYAQMVLFETTRLYPPSWGYPRQCKEEMKFDGYTIPANSLVIPMVHFTQRDPRFWESPEKFNPDRFGTEARKNIHRFAHFPYGIGARMCLGANLAPMVLLPIIVKIFQRYHFEFTPRFAGDPRPDFGFEIHPKDAIYMKVERN